MPAERDSLIQTLPPDVHEDAERLYNELDQQQPDAPPDPRDFFMQAYRRGWLDAGKLRDEVLSHEKSRRIDRAHVRTQLGSVRLSPDILGPLGAGAMGEVLLAKDDLGRVVAVKRLLPEMAGRKGVVRRFFREAQVTAQLDHPSIVPIHGLVREGDDGQLAYAMKLVQGQTLEDYFEAAAEQWSSRGRVDEEHALPARLDRFLSVCDAIAYAHERGVVHRDLKPENIMVGAFGEVLVMDWGIAKLVRDERPEDLEDVDVDAEKKRRPRETRVGMLMGTPRYMSPEQAEGRNDILDPRSDQYALGLILQELVTLRPAVKGDLEVEACLAWAMAAKRQAFAVLHRDQPLPKQLVAIVEKACQANPKDRYPSVAVMAEDIRRFLRDEPIVALPDTFGDRIGRWVSRNRGKMLALLAGVVALGIAGVAGTGVAGAAALGASRYAAQQHEEQLARVLRDTNLAAMKTDAAFRVWAGQLNALAYAAEQALAETSGAALDPSTSAEPPRLRRSDRYPVQVDLNWPSIGHVAGAERKPQLRSLVALGPQFRSTLADSAGLIKSARPGAQRNAIEAGAPIVWARIYTNEGAIASYPGTSLEPITVGSDYRQAPWFKANEHDRSIVWHPPRADSHKLGLVVVATRTLSDAVGNFYGVAAIDVSLQYVRDQLLAPPPWAERTWLVDGDGRVVVSSDDAPATATAYNPSTLPIPALRDAVAGSDSGTELIRHDGVSYQATWARLASTGWTFVSLTREGSGPAR